VVLGLASSGLHANGFSLVRRVLVDGREDELSLPRTDLGGATLGDALLEPTRIYARQVARVLAVAGVRAMAHITGGGVTENLARSLPDGMGVRVHRGAWKRPPVFGVVQAASGLDDEEMFRTFNMGIGFALVVTEADAPAVAAALTDAGERVYEIGEVTEGEDGVVYA
jgi:phosphoribosylformylglycinamidine cyclo-ligase